MEGSPIVAALYVSAVGPYATAGSARAELRLTDQLGTLGRPFRPSPSSSGGM